MQNIKNFKNLQVILRSGYNVNKLFKLKLVFICSTLWGENLSLGSKL